MNIAPVSQSMRQIKQYQMDTIADFGTLRNVYERDEGSVEMRLGLVWANVMLYEMIYSDCSVLVVQWILLDVICVGVIDG